MTDCPNCGAAAPGGLFTIGHGERSVTHCGCYHAGDRDRVLCHVSDEILPEMTRASGDCICTQCSKTYRRHPLDPNWLDWNSEPYLNRLCDGRLVKL